MESDSRLVFEEFEIAENPPQLWRTESGNREDVRLSPLEGHLLVFLARRAGRWVTIQSLIDDVWGDKPQTESSAIHATISRLKKKLQGLGRFIQGTKGNYRLNAPLRRRIGSTAPYFSKRLKSDRKNVLCDSTVSNRLLRGETPTWARCVMSSRTIGVEVDKKDRPLVDGLGYNHFIAPSAIFSISIPGQSRPVWLGYTRAAQPREPGYRLTTGPSILWSASFYYNDAGSPDAPMDAWVQLVQQDRSAAAQAFVTGPACTLFQVFRHKITFARFDVGCKPFAVVTNDLRNTLELSGVVYTQYVFQVNLVADPTRLSGGLRGLLDGIRAPRAQPYELPADFQTNELVSPDGRRNLMDCLAWEGLHNDKPSLQQDTARFTRGFVIA